MKNFKLIVLLSLQAIAIAKLNTTEKYPSQSTLQSPDLIYLYWRHTNTSITFELHFKTNKLILFGVYGDKFSDVVVGWMNDDQTGHFSDQYLKNMTLKPTMDKTQNWFPINAFKKDNYTVLKFTRKIKVCDSKLVNEDLDILTGSIILIFATGSSTSDLSIKSLNIKSLNILTQTKGPFNCIIQPRLEFTSKPSENFANFVDLVDDGQYRLYWNYTQSDFIGEVHCRTGGWVGFGLSPNGNMDQSDVFVGWISKGVANFTVRF